jgi:hypothetical protein
MIRLVRLFGEAAPGRCCLISRVDGHNHRLGELQAGQPFWTDAAGRELAPEAMQALAAGSQMLDFVGC